MEQESEQIFNPGEQYKMVSNEYCKRMRGYVDSVEAKLKEVSEHMNMNDPYHADALRSFTWGLMGEVEREVKRIGRDYEIEVCNLRNIVVNE